jgi:uncharacterized protein YggE
MIQYTVPMRILLLFWTLPLLAQVNDNRLAVTGDAEIKVPPADVLTAGANRVYGVDFQTSEFRKYRYQVRELAVKAAIEKATAMASAYGRSNRASNMMQNVSPNVISSEPGGDDVSVTMAPGRISVHASVSLTFRLIP